MDRKNASTAIPHSPAVPGGGRKAACPHEGFSQSSGGWNWVRRLPQKLLGCSSGAARGKWAADL